MMRGKVTAVDAKGVYVQTAEFGVLGPCQWATSLPVAGQSVVLANVGSDTEPDLIVLGAAPAASAGFLNVCDYGAVPDGETDCTDAFNAALAAAQAAGGRRVSAYEEYVGATFDDFHRPVVFIPNGRYLIQPLDPILTRQIEIRGAGQFATTLIAAGTGAHIQFGEFDDDPDNYWYGPASGYAVGGFMMETPEWASPTAEGSRTADAIADHGNGTAVVHDLYLRGFRYGFYGTSGVDFVTFDNVTANRCDVGVYLGPASQQVALRSCYFNWCAEGLVAEWAPQVSVSDCWFTFNSGQDIVIDAPATLRSGITQGLPGDTGFGSWAISGCWFESQEAGTSRGPDSHILITGDSANRENFTVTVSDALIIEEKVIGSGNPSFVEATIPASIHLQRVMLSGQARVAAHASASTPRFHLSDVMGFSPWWAASGSGSIDQSTWVNRWFGNVSIHTNGQPILLDTDTTLGRGGAGFMAVPMLVKAGVPSDSDYDFQPPNGTLAVNSSGGAGARLYCRISGTWTAIA